MRGDQARTRILGPAMLALVLGAGGAWAEAAGFEDGSGGDVAVSDGESPISGDGVEGEVTVTSADDTDLPPGFCDDCEETGEIVQEVLAEGSGQASGGEGRESGLGRSLRVTKAERTGAGDLCASPQHYVAWMCEWQGLSRP